MARRYFLIDIKVRVFNLLKPTGNFAYHQIENSELLHAKYTAFMCFVWIAEQTATLVFITEVESVYCAVRTESLNTT